jgi:hypothetical protein
VVTAFKQEVGVSDQVMKDPNFAKAVDAAGGFKEEYGTYLGAALYIFTLRASKPPQSAWKSLIWSGSAVAVALITTRADLLTWLKWLVP